MVQKLALDFALKSNNSLKEIAKKLKIPSENLIFRMTDAKLVPSHTGISSVLLDGTQGCFCNDKYHLAVCYSMSDGRLISNYISMFSWSGGSWDLNGMVSGKKFRKLDEKQSKYQSSKARTIMMKLVHFQDMNSALDYLESVKGTF